jgi:hypothetical protein
MTVFTPGTGGGFPSDCNTLSRAVVWAFTEAERLQPKDTYTINPGEPPVRAVSTMIRPINGHGTRIICQGYFPLQPDHKVRTGKTWEKLIPSVFLTSSSPQNATDTFLPGTSGSCPNTVTSIPRLIVWLGLCWEQTNGSDSIIETPYNPNTGLGGNAIPVAICDNTDTFDYGPLQYVRCSVPFADDHNLRAEVAYKKALIASNVILSNGLTTA